MSLIVLHFMNSVKQAMRRLNQDLSLRFIVQILYTNMLGNDNCVGGGRDGRWCRGAMPRLGSMRRKFAHTRHPQGSWSSPAPLNCMVSCLTFSQSRPAHVSVLHTRHRPCRVCCSVRTLHT